MTIDGYSLFRRNYDLELPGVQGVQDRRLEDLGNQVTGLRDRLTRLSIFYTGRGHLITHLNAALDLIMNADSLNEAKILAYQAADHIKEMANECHPGHPQWGHPYEEYLELPSKGNPFAPKSISKDEVKSLYDSLGIKDHDGSAT